MRSVSNEDGRTFRREYIQSRQSYSKAVKRAKRLFQTQERRQLEAELGNPKKFWRSIKQLNISQTKKKCNLMEVLDPEGNIRCNEEAMDKCNHFSRLLGVWMKAFVERGVMELRSQPGVSKIAWTSVTASVHLSQQKMRAMGIGKSEEGCCSRARWNCCRDDEG